MAVRSLVVGLLVLFEETHFPGVNMAEEHALSKSEFDTLTKLLAGAHMSGDTAILEKHVEREYYNIASDGLLEKYDKNLTGGMSDAAKRRIEAELESEFEMLDPSDHMDPLEAALEEKHLQDLVEHRFCGWATCCYGASWCGSDAIPRIQRRSQHPCGGSRWPDG